MKPKKLLKNCTKSFSSKRWKPPEKRQLAIFMFTNGRKQKGIWCSLAMITGILSSTWWSESKWQSEVSEAISRWFMKNPKTSTSSTTSNWFLEGSATRKETRRFAALPITPLKHSIISGRYSALTIRNIFKALGRLNWWRLWWWGKWTPWHLWRVRAKVDPSSIIQQMVSTCWKRSNIGSIDF